MTNFQNALDWISAEHEAYEDKKFTDEVDDAKSAEDWSRPIEMYLHRAAVLGLDNPVGRQAVAKAATTAVAYLEAVLRVYGSVPLPGFPSGQLEGEWRDST